MKLKDKLLSTMEVLTDEEFKRYIANIKMGLELIRDGVSILLPFKAATEVPKFTLLDFIPPQAGCVLKRRAKEDFLRIIEEDTQRILEGDKYPIEADSIVFAIYNFCGRKWYSEFVFRNLLPKEELPDFSELPEFEEWYREMED